MQPQLNRMKKKGSFWFYSLIFMDLFLVLASSCKKDNSVPLELKTGDSFKGGIIFYLDATKKHGLIAATSDQCITDPWWNGSFVTTGATSTTDGLGNTIAIIGAQGNSGVYAAKLCRDYRGGGFNDWFLPSKDQLNSLFSQKSIVGGFVDEIYWSSTEVGEGEAWIQYFLNGEQWIDNTSDGANVHARAIRAF
jgi:hypothetical protein